jgi:hypothetical protein
MSNKIKKWNDYLNEDFDQSLDNMKNTTAVYNKYKNRVVSTIDKENLDESSENFEKFIDGLPDNEKEASDLLRSLFNSEMMKLKIESLETQKQQSRSTSIFR